MKDDILKRIGEIVVDGVDIHRCVAVQTLGDIGDTKCLPILTQALLDEDEDVRVDAAVALGQINDPTSGQALLDNLIGDPCCDVKVAAINALIKMQFDPVIPWLEKLLVGRPQDMAWDEADFYQGGWDDWLDLQTLALQGVGQLGLSKTIPLIKQAMDDEEAQDLSEFAIIAFAQMGEAGLQEIPLMMKNRTERTRRLIAKHVNDHALLNDLLNDPSVGVRAQAARSFYARNPEDTRLMALLWDEQAELRSLAVSLVGVQNQEWLPKLLHDEDEKVRRSVLELLIDCPIMEMAEPITEIAQSDHGEFSAMALQALVKAVPISAFSLIREALEKGYQPHLLNRLLDVALGENECSDAAIQMLIDFASSKDIQKEPTALEPEASVETHGLSTLEEITAPSGPRPKRPVAIDEGKDHAFELLGYIETKDVCSHLIKAVQQETGDLQQVALRSLLKVAHIDPAGAGELMKTVLQNASLRPIVLNNLSGLNLDDLLIEDIQADASDAFQLVLALKDKEGHLPVLLAGYEQATLGQKHQVIEVLAAAHLPNRFDELFRIAFLHESECADKVIDCLNHQDQKYMQTALLNILNDEGAKEKWGPSLKMLARLLR